jgi:hypothetical protein
MTDRAGWTDWAPVVLASRKDAPQVRAALARLGLPATAAPNAADAFGAVVGGANLLIVDASHPDALALLRGVRRRIDDGWSDCAIVGYSPSWRGSDDDIWALLDAVARYPVTAADLDLAVRVAGCQRHDRHPEGTGAAAVYGGSPRG